jgi:hypothetical protein
MSSDQHVKAIAMNTTLLSNRARFWMILASAVAILSTNVGAESAYEQWIQSFKGISVADQSPTADPDLDELVNVAEQLLGLDPTIPLEKDPNRDNAPALHMDPRGGLRFLYRVNPAAAASKEIIHGIQKSEISTNGRI